MLYTDNALYGRKELVIWPTFWNCLYSAKNMMRKAEKTRGTKTSQVIVLTKKQIVDLFV